ncbi:hypothetical protein JOD63_000507 [Microbacterium terrae]|uniref:GyrI-like small molecule binding domain-containing protein n=1 Tax=Microbacterium terrae TaxID=69369 RepID=A0A0M2GW31_9MICO|nr:GyrI-like domain-containing protein [Microbacterium terrae]KJL37707.1 hypothetical protein RS81_03465 [Microbacterium terrae]MBP1076539.1 hypothetical protein [Microbacterium terrae]GLJ97368.1 hypothetical protein GCM10017594_05650 [Microbacterium terrae]
MDKVDLKAVIPAYRAQRGRFEIVQVPPLRYLMIEGAGDPNTAAAYSEAVSALYSVAYKLKFRSKRELGRDYVVMPLEALWWADDMDAFTAARDKGRWQWTLLNLVPDWIDADLVAETQDAVARAKDASPAVVRLRLEELAEGRCVQTLHVGSYDDEAPVLAAMHGEFIPAAGLQMTGRHHEVYLNDPRRTEPDRLRTILRQPVGPVM